MNDYSLHSIAFRSSEIRTNLNLISLIDKIKSFDLTVEPFRFAKELPEYYQTIHDTRNLLNLKEKDKLLRVTLKQINSPAQYDYLIYTLYKYNVNIDLCIEQNFKRSDGFVEKSTAYVYRFLLPEVDKDLSLNKEPVVLVAHPLYKYSETTYNPSRNMQRVYFE